MAKEALFSQAVRILGPRFGHGEIAGYPPKCSEQEAISDWNDSVYPKYSTLDVYVANAARAFVLGELSPITVCMTSDQEEDMTFSSEYLMQDGKVCLTMMNVKGNIKASVIDGSKTYKALPSQGSPKTEFDLSGVMSVVLMCAASVYPEIMDELNEAKSEYDKDGKLNDKRIFKICDFVEMGVKQKKILVNLVSGNFNLLSKKDVDTGICKGSILLGKKPKYLFGEASEASLEGRRSLTFGKLYSLPELKEWRENHSWSEEEQELIPKISDDFPVSTDVQKMANRYLKTRSSKRPMVSILWRGVSGLGKSTGTEILAALLGMPLLRLTCFSTMETSDFLTSFVPDNGEKSIDSLPSDEDMEFDPELAFFKMTGTWKDNVTTELCENVRFQLSSSKSKDSTPRFKMISSNFITALEKGYICEVQEISRIKDQGVPVGLNEYDRAGAMIPKADGSFAKRHPEALVVYTDNVGYATCHDLDPAVLRRMSFVLDTREISKSDALARIKYNTGFEDKDQLEKMYSIWLAIQDHCGKNGIDSGICTVNELEQWVALAQIDGFDTDTLLEDLKEAVINKATADSMEQEELLNVVKLLL